MSPHLHVSTYIGHTILHCPHESLIQIYVDYVPLLLHICMIHAFLDGSYTHYNYNAYDIWVWIYVLNLGLAQILGLVIGCY